MSEKEKIELGSKPTLCVPKLSLGLIQYSSTRPMVAYLFCSRCVNGKPFSPSVWDSRERRSRTLEKPSARQFSAEQDNEHHVFWPLHANLTCTILRMEPIGKCGKTCLVSNGQEIVVNIQGRKRLRDRLFGFTIRPSSDESGVDLH